MSHLEERLFHLFTQPKNLDELIRMVEVLKTTVVSLIQDVDVLMSMLREKGLFDQARYKSLRMDRMVADHSGAGPAPFQHYSYFPYTLSEEDFLRHQFKLTDEEVREYKNEVEHVESLS